MKHRFSHDLTKYTYKTIEKQIHAHKTKPSLRHIDNHIHPSPQKLDSSCLYKSIEIGSAVTKPHSTATKSSKKVKNKITSSLIKPKKRQKTHYNDDFSGIALSFSKVYNTHKYSESLNIFQTNSIEHKNTTNKYRTIIKTKSQEKLRDPKEEVPEYIILEGEILKVTSFNVNLLLLQKLQKNRSNLEKLYQQNDQNEDQFYEINQFYNQKAKIIQKAWRCYFFNKTLKFPTLKNCQQQNQNQSQIQQQIGFNQISQLKQSSQKNHSGLKSSSHSQQSFLDDHSLQSIENSTQRHICKGGVLEKEQQQLSLVKCLPQKPQKSEEIFMSHESLLEQNILSYHSLLIQLRDSEKISEQVYQKKLAQLEKWSYIQHNQTNYLKKMLLKQEQKNNQLLKMKQIEQSIRQKMKQGELGKQEVDLFLKEVNLQDEKDNFLDYLFPQCNSAVFEDAQKSISQKLVQQKSIEDLSQQQEERLERSIYTKQFKILLDNSPIQKFPLLFEEHHRFKRMIEQRIFNQLGYTDVDTLPTNTSASSICNFITKLCQLITNEYAYEFVDSLNTVYGLPPILRLKTLRQKYNSQHTPIEDQIISYVVLQRIQQNFHSDGLYNQYQQIHNRAIFDAINQSIKTFRPYFYSNGIPYPWCEDKVLTFYEISPDNIVDVFEKIKYKIVQTSSYLCGLILPVGDECKSKHNSSEAIEEYQYLGGLLSQIRSQNMLKAEIGDVCECNFQWFLDDEEFSKILIQISQFMYLKMIVETVAEMYRMQRR